MKQKLDIEDQLELAANYNPKKNLTSIEIQKLEKDGIIFLELLTNQGVLETKY